MSNFVFAEDDPFSPVRYSYEVAEVLCSRKTAHQDLLIFRHPRLGKVLVLDGVVQLTEQDEYFYHEMLAQVPLHAHPAPTDVLIIGGGDGGTLREVLKHESVKRALLVELDAEVIGASREFFPGVSAGFADPRTHVLEQDGADFLAQTQEQFDLVIVDSTDPVGPAESLFTSQCFGHAFSALKGDGLFVAQTESLHFHRDFVCRVQRELARVFRFANLYTVSLSTYAGNWWTFSIGSKVYDPKQVLRRCQVPTRYYDEDVHRHAFLPPSLYGRLISED